MVLLHPGYLSNIAHFSVLANREACWDLSGHYQKQTYRNRTYIATDRGALLLSIPVIHNRGKGKQHYKEVKIDYVEAWQRTHWRSIETAYRTSPFFEFYEEELRSIYEKQDSYLLDFNVRTTEVLLNCTGLKKPESKLDTYEKEPQNNIDARFLIDAKNKIDFSPIAYHQVFAEKHGYLPNLSVLDLLCNEGPNTITYLKQQTLSFLP
jgi:hypothetical protein